MKCTSCKEGSLSPTHLEGSLRCQQCTNCEGILLMLTDYLRWKDLNGKPEFTRNENAKVRAEDTEKALLCPITGRLMTKYKISKDTDHRLDLSPTINAIWMDSGEWELLKERGLVGKLNNIFTDHWQHDIRGQESADILEALYDRKFGKHYPAIKEFRAKLEEMNKSEVLAYLLADDPYEP